MNKGVGWVIIEIKDNGEGIEEKDLPFIFDRFYHIQSKVRPDSKGHGLGLSLCKAIIQDHHGKISAKSTPSKGSTFYIQLPLNQ